VGAAANTKKGSLVKLANSAFGSYHGTMARSAPDDVDRLRREVDRGFREKIDAEELLPLLARLARAAPPESEAWIYAHRHLAELGVEHDPWRAALFARRVIALCPDDDGAWAVLGLAQSLLGHYRYAARAYERALVLAPQNPWYAHNLGHLYDVALDRPLDALPLLARATEAQTGESDIAASYAHALARCGKVASAKRILKRAIRHGATADQMALWRWLDAGAPTYHRPQPQGADAARKKPKRRRSRARQGAAD
jgi:tetratricopeptide (TPR) repeat protein